LGLALVQRPNLARHVVVPVWYATDRKAIGSTAPGDWYSGDRSTLTFGRVTVSIPDSHEKGKLEKPRLFRLEFRDDPEKHVVLLTLAERDVAAWKAEVMQGLSLRSGHPPLHHGSTWTSSARRGAAWLPTTKFPGLCVCGWPSGSASLKHTVDEDVRMDSRSAKVLTLLMGEVSADAFPPWRSMGSAFWPANAADRLNALARSAAIRALSSSRPTSTDVRTFAKVPRAGRCPLASDVTKRLSARKRCTSTPAREMPPMASW
jgi:hypothetical protein